jgi:bifunctional non-homologous end joining protein LigD
MPTFPLPAGVIPAELPQRLQPQIVTPSAEPPGGEGWLHEVKHDGHRLLAIVSGDDLKLVSRNGHDRTHLFSEPFRGLARSSLVLDGEIAVPDERGVTHIDLLTQAMRQCRPERLAYFAFDLLHLDGHDLRGCAIEDRMALLRDVIGAAGCERIVKLITSLETALRYSRRCTKSGPRASSPSTTAVPYRGGLSRDWLKIRSARPPPL